MTEKPDDICTRPEWPTASPTDPLVAPLQPSTVYRCASPEEAAGLLSGELPGYVYSRDGHPNAAQLAAKGAELHGTERATVTGSGMAALALAMLSQLNAGDHVLVSHALYGRSLRLFTTQGPRLGLTTSVVDTSDLAAVKKAIQPTTRMIVVETISNPLLRVADIGALAEIAHANGAQLLVDNSLASPVVCRPADFGAELVMESIT
ncbi:MAG: aminotransferase class I/II-fold pyridoxal phosphate-dependent enzyme [Planctomycetia bacterium]|nr:aminotransferase class I/II-fold pyridoxal phosphate-dependent enzyme [Planctomycetia bacterium]